MNDPLRLGRTPGLRAEHGGVFANRRVDAALARIDRGDLPTFAEYDLFYGLTGIGAYLLRTEPEGRALERILQYLVALPRPLAADGRGLPGWWVRHDPASAGAPASTSRRRQRSAGRPA